MSDIKQIYQDFDYMCREYNCIYFDYQDLHAYDAGGHPSAMKDFLHKSEAFLGPKYREILLKEDLIVPYFDGDYDFKFFDNLQNGGASFYGMLGDDYGMQKKMLIFFSCETENDRYNMYHEAGHVMQSELDLFDNNFLYKMYEFYIKGIKNDTDGKLSKKMADISEYSTYLWEAHADAFASACMLLRAKDDADFRKTNRRLYIDAGSNLFWALRDKSQEYPSMSYYASFPVEKAVLKKFTQYYKDGEFKRFFLPTGEIDMKALALDVEEIVRQNAYSPRTFKQLLEKDFKSGHGKHEKGWRHLIPMAAATEFFSHFYKDKKLTKQKIEYHDDVDNSRQQIPFVLLPKVDRAAEIINLCCCLDNQSISIKSCLQVLELDEKKYAELDIITALHFGQFPDEIVALATDKILQEKPKAGELVNMILENCQKNTNIVLKDANHRGSAEKVLRAMHSSPEVREQVWQMYRSRQNCQTAEIFPERLAASANGMSISQQNKLKLNYAHYLKWLGRKLPEQQRQIYWQMLNNVDGLRETDWKKLQNMTEGKSENNKIFLMYYKNPEVFAEAVERSQHDMQNQSIIANKKFVSGCRKNKYYGR